jgi:hypothetical protein
MDNEHGHGVSVDADGIRSALAATRKIRLGLDVLWGELSPDIGTDAIMDTLWNLHERLCEAELKELRIWGLPQQYVIISPINPMSLPGPEDMEKIAHAIRTLDDLGLIVIP